MIPALCNIEFYKIDIDFVLHYIYTRSVLNEINNNTRLHLILRK